MAVDTNLITALGAGSGVDVKALAQGLADAEIQPRKDAVQAKIDKTEAKISGYSAMMAVLNNFKTAVETVDSTTDFANLSVQNSNTSAVAFSTSAAAGPGSHSIDVQALAQSQRTISDGFENITSEVNGGDAFTLTLVKGPIGSQTTVDIEILETETNASAMVSKINQADAGVTAQLVDTGVDGPNRYKVVLTGKPGTDNQFTVSTNAADTAGINFATAADQQAADASLVVNGVSITRSSNTINDVIPGVTLTLLATTTTSASVAVSRDTSGVKEKIQGIVQAYNDMVSDFAVLTGPKSDDEEDIFSGSLKGDSTPRTVLAQIRTTFFGESDTKGDTIGTFRDLGVSVDKDGVVSLDETVLDSALSGNFEEVVKTLAGRTSETVDGETVIKRGLGVELAARVRDLMAPSGIIVSQSNSAETQVNKYEDKLTDLEDRLKTILDRYTKQFAAMESLVGQITSMRENLKGQFDALSNAYKK
jgi:flagellar hook-associated protein 2